MNLRPAVAADIPALVDLWREMWDANRRSDPRLEASPIAESVMAAWMEDQLRSERCRIVVGEAEGRLAGYAAAIIRENPPVVPDQFTGLVTEICVTGTHRRSGLGSRLLEELHLWFRVKHIRQVEVEVSVRNAAARSFWRRHGYGEFIERLRLDLGE